MGAGLLPEFAAAQLDMCQPCLHRNAPWAEQHAHGACRGSAAHGQEERHTAALLLVRLRACLWDGAHLLIRGHVQVDHGAVWGLHAHMQDAHHSW